MKANLHLVFGVLAGAAIVAAITGGLIVAGMPQERRLERLDERRLSDLQRIHHEIQRIVLDPDRPGTLRRQLPVSLEQAQRLAVDEDLALTDPATGARYGYRVLDEHTYELTATFDRSRQADREVFWNHPPGRHAFRIDVLELERFR